MVDHVEEDDFVLIENADGDEEDAVSVSSSRSSQVMVDDPSKDVLMMHGESPVRSVVLPLAPSDAERAPTEPLQPPCTEADGPHEEAMKEEVLPQEEPKFVCSSCSLEVGMQSDIIWEGYMGANKSAYLFSKVSNLVPSAEPREQQLSTGHFLLRDVRCKSCSAAFGWTYIKAWNQDQKYKEGTTIVQRSLLQLVGDSPSESTNTAVHCQ